mmetsp:Transcript_14765/g.30093  ORF Transcript_14765/g.30093 Transcript_14765/m.30093 type:complete len:85 (+) Transcript_14765:305-559(+)
MLPALCCTTFTFGYSRVFLKRTGKRSLQSALHPDIILFDLQRTSQEAVELFGSLFDMFVTRLEVTVKPSSTSLLKAVLNMNNGL